jgi:hypothetical protein
MTAMRYNMQSVGALLCMVAVMSLPAKLAAQSSASATLEFQARIQPTGGRLEPVRGLAFYLLRKSVADIHSEAERAEPAMDIDSFVDSLSLSLGLKAWMKKHHTVSLSGTEFTKQLTADDILGVPEFYDAYMQQNGGSLNAGVPVPKYKESERQSNPEKYKREHDQFQQQMHRYLTAHPESTLGIDSELGESNPAQRWAQRQTEQQRKIDRRAQVLAQTTYLAAQLDSDSDGHGIVRGLPPGPYWLTTLETPAIAGDVRLRWDVPVQLAAGQTVRIDLNNFNAIEPASGPPR